MNLEERLEAFGKLGERIGSLDEAIISQLTTKAKSVNGWFSEENVSKGLSGLAFMLDHEKLKKWVAEYELEPAVPKITGIIMAGNIPFVGFHDLLCVLISGHFAAVKLSSQDKVLMETIIEWIVEIEPRFKRNIQIKDKLEEIDGVICTGSDNTARYFEYYFGKYPNIIRKNRTSIAILDGSETSDDLQSFGDDLFSYYGLGCRNVSKLMIPEEFDPTTIFPSLEEFEQTIHHNKYKNNYDYNKAIYLVNKEDHFDNGFLLLKESEDIVSPTAVLYFQRYKSSQELNTYLSSNDNKIQCVVGKGFIPFGQAQSPELWDYADGVDTLKFLESLN